jgi:hypothetical protein
MPAGTLAIALLLARQEVAGHTWLDSLRGIGLLIASLELGYVTGLISTDIFAAARGLAARHRRARPIKNNRLVLGRFFAPGWSSRPFSEPRAMRVRDPIRWNKAAPSADELSMPLFLAKEPRGESPSVAKGCPF